MLRIERSQPSALLTELASARMKGLLTIWVSGWQGNTRQIQVMPTGKRQAITNVSAQSSSLRNTTLQFYGVSVTSQLR
jgi:hypothetical protein